MKASLSNYRQSPRKVRLVADMIRGKSVANAMSALSFLPKKSAPDIQKLLASAVANAQNAGQNPETLFVKHVSVDKGQVLRRMKPMARGRGVGVRKTMSIVRIELGSTADATPKAARAKKAAKKSAKKAAK